MRREAIETSGPAAPVMEDALPADVIAPAPRIDAWMRAYLHGLDLPVNLRSACEYALLGPGKRARPLLVWHSCAAVDSARVEHCLPAAAAVEMVHAFSLVHDDLPGLDDDDLRRGRPTLHKAAGEAMAVLAGDALLTLAFRVLAEEVEDPVLSRSLVAELAAGTSGMIVGQVYDTLGGFRPGEDDNAKLRLIHSNKTGALIRASCRMGALVGASPGPPGPDRSGMIDAITRYGETVGLLFQVVDDLLDVTQTTDHLGKKAAKDAGAGKLTYPGVLGVDQTRREAERLGDAAMRAIEGIGPGATPLRHICRFMSVRTR